MWDFPFVTTCDDRFFSSVRGPHDIVLFAHLPLQAQAMVQFWPFRQHPHFLLQSFLQLHLPRSFFDNFPRMAFGFGILIRGFLVGVSIVDSLFFFSEVADFGDSS